jgi:hypothetical protein
MSQAFVTSPSPASIYDQRFSQQSVAEIGGTVVAVQGEFVVLRDNSTAHRYPVYLGPTLYLRSQAFSLVKGMKVRAVGSIVSIDGRLVIIAEQVRGAGKTLVLRDQSGLAFWDARRNGQVTSIVQNYTGPVGRMLQMSTESELFATVSDSMTTPRR